MTEPPDTTPSAEQVRRSWESIAGWWDAQVGEGNAMQSHLLWPTAERLLHLQPGERVLEVACGNGSFARRLARQGVSVLATDVAERFITLARGRTAPEEKGVEYRQLDATSDDALCTFGDHTFDGVACLMGLMDMPTIDPLMREVPRLLRPGGRFVFAVTHPCFNGAEVVRTLEESDSGSDLQETRSVRVSRYATPVIGHGVGIPGQPEPHFYFDRPIHALLDSAFRAGLVVDGFEEPTFDEPVPGARSMSVSRFPEIPPALVVRLRPA
ncbi:MAG: class I SAM-dependent methyltransferase [Thermoplasmata archaeon]|nr:class I SAM-dependent methyltransferase [Thermoplasmata archaeon]